MSAKAFRGGLVAVIFIGATAGAAAWWMAHKGLESTDDAYVHGDVTTIRPKVAGYVGALMVRDNQRVRAGDVLVRLEDHDYRARLDEASASTVAGRAAVDSAKARLEAQRALIAEAKAGVAIWTAERIRARKELARVSKLIRNDVASRKRLDDARAAASKASAGLAQAKAKYDAAQSQMPVLKAEIARQIALSRGAEAREHQARLNLENTVIRAPTDGVVANRVVHVGQFARAGATLFSLVRLDTVWIEANFKETQIGAMAPGQPAEITVDAYDGLSLSGHVVSLAPASGAQFSLLPPENATGNFTKIVQRVPVRIAPRRPNPLLGKLLPGLSVEVTVDTRTSGDSAALSGAGASIPETAATP